ncbi:cryptochrome/photolyase family protein [uncultured Sphingomonas sp.]|uniref:cryptochrome/photolyase family protein n=1 Tax=uncultured Sphingomonas sp. TaxID=158754 RepID=UPI0035CAEEE0
MILIPVLGDQCSHGLASLRDVYKDNAVILMMEVVDETTYVKHHKVKIALILSAMRHFAAELEADGWTVDYVRLDQTGNTGSFTGEVQRAIGRHQVDRVRIVEAGEWRVQKMIEGWAEASGLPVEILVDDRFFCSILDFQTWAQSRHDLVMEPFYRLMRGRTGLLMDGAEPVGGVWNLDKQNRMPPRKGVDYPQPMRFSPDAVTSEVLVLVEHRFADHFGSLDNFHLPVTAGEARQALDHFVRAALPDFGNWQDAMVTDERFLFHSWLSPALNCGLLDARTVCDAVAEAHAAGDIPLNSAEGFIRQILGWREYMRGVYWLEMPDFANANALRHERPLPEFYWTGETDMLCLRQAIHSTRDLAYAHHIERLMVLGNFALLAGVLPQAVSDWFLIVYADAYEWVELPNVIGMSQFADGGRLGSKPYVSGGAYINRMSTYCGECRYDVKLKTGPDACPFNALYWDFLARHERTLRGNHRLSPVYRNWDRMTDEQKRTYRSSAGSFLETLEPAAKDWART